MYGLVKRFVRVMCTCPHIYDFVFLTWFPTPTYPDGDPLTLRINTMGIDINNIPNIDVVSLNDIQPSRVSVDIDRVNSMYMMRIEGTDTVPVTVNP